MYFEVLGPLRVTTNAGEVPVRGRKQLLLLTSLLTRLNRPVAPDVLAQVLWDGQIPESAFKTLRWHVHQLRQLLGEPERIVHDASGYLLRARDEELDATRFEALCAQGFAARRGADPDTAAACLAEAVGLWRGPAYGEAADVPGMREESLRLEQLRLDALEQHSAAELDRGNHNGIVATLTTLVGNNPLHEGFRAQLMLALYRCGRQADALRVFREGRVILSRELGLDPGPGLRNLERAILNGDASLDPPPAKPARPAAPIPAELPADLSGFTGRAGEAERLCGLLGQPGGSHPAVTALAGPAGIGKSTLAVHIAHRIADGFPDGQLYVNLHGSTPNVAPLRAVDALARFLRSLGHEPDEARTDTEELAARFRSATAGRRLLFVLDNASDTAQVRPLLPAGNGCAVVITSRRILATLDQAVHHQLDMLSPDESRDLLSRLVGEQRVAAEPKAAARIARQCGYMPLALSIAAARLNARPAWRVAALAARLDREDRRLSELGVTDRQVRNSFMVSYRELSADPDGAAAARLFRRIGLHDGTELRIPVAAALADVTDEHAERLLDALVDAQLVESLEPERYRMHDLLRFFARERVLEEEPEAERNRAIDRMLNRTSSVWLKGVAIPSGPIDMTTGTNPLEKI